MIPPNDSVRSQASHQHDSGIYQYPKMLLKTDLPGVLFTMRYPDDTGFVWNTIALGRERAGALLREHANCFIAYSRLTGNPSFQHQSIVPVELDCYDMSATGKAALSNFILQNRVKVIVFMSALPSTVDLGFFRRLGVKTLNTENDSFDHRKKDPLIKKAVKFITRRILGRQLHDLHLANAKSQYRFLSSYSQIPRSRLALLTDAVDCDRFQPGDKTEARRRLDLDERDFVVICVSQARSEKRIDFLIRAAKRIVESNPQRQIKFLYVGDGGLIDDLKKLVAELGLNDVFRFYGRQDNVAPFYQAADLMVHAAYRESFGLAIVEGMACGLPVVASAAAGPSETILDGHTGALIEIDDFDGFVAAIDGYIHDQAKVAAQGSNAREHAFANYSMVNYEKILAGEIQRFL